ncbi:hypothetical protein LCGC14_0603060 [marine sediment metagenome]|uniref:DNA methylase N-4/N-6 domain-containing protein n=1 Tax=marine sediment metagenome TaxID=412755 RepID=A0A0F9TW18_9ZZZZ
MELEYWFEMPNKWTFRMKKLRKFITNFIYELPKGSEILIPFAGMYRFDKFIFSDYNFIYNDINLNIESTHNINAYKLVWLYERESFNCIIADPPYSVYAAHKYYKLHNYTEITVWRKAADYLLKPGGIYIELGWNSSGLRKSIANKISLGVCCTGGNHRDILILVQRKREHDNVKPLF